MKNTICKKYVIILPLVLFCIAAISALCLACSPKTNDEHIHTFIVTVIDPTCTESGYTLHECACGENYKDTFVDATGHAPKTAVKENIVDADCTTDGSYDEVVYCDVCNEKLSVEHKTINKLGHAPKTAVKENIVAADCTTDGSYDEVVYCDVCNEKLSVEHKTINKLGHDYKDGICTVCGEPEYYNVEDLQFTPTQDGSGYIVSGFNGNPTYAYIPETYNDKPVTSIDNNAFYNCTALTSVIIPKSVTTIGSSAFEGCTNLSSLTMRNGLISIGNSSFYNCSNLTSVDIPEGVTSIGQYAFDKCTALTSITVPNSLVKIGNDAFSTCPRVNSVYYTGDIGEFCSISGVGNLMRNQGAKNLYLNGEQVTELVIPDSITSIAEYTFYYCTGLKSVTIGKGVTTIGDNAFINCTSLETVYWNATSCKGGWFTESSGNSFIADIFASCNNLATAVIGDNVQSIPGYLFYQCRSLTSVNIPNSVTSIGNFAFEYCSGLESITIGENVTTIGNYAFEYCTSLKTVYWNATDCVGGWFDDGIRPIFYNCDNLTTAVIGENVNSIPDYAFYRCGSLTRVNFPDSLTVIGNYAFKYCTDLESITIGKGVITIGDYAFQYCSSMESVNIGESVTTIGDYAFQYCTSLETVYWNAIYCMGGWYDDGVRPIFYNCDNLSTVVMGENVQWIPAYLFGFCSSLTSVNIPDSVTTIDKYGFYGCSGLESITIGKNVTTIGNYAFYNCSGLGSIILGKDVTTIGNNAFYNCSGLYAVYYLSSEAVSLSLGSGNTDLTNALWYFYSDDEPTDDGQWWHFDGNGNVAIW